MSLTQPVRNRRGKGICRRRRRATPGAAQTQDRGVTEDVRHPPAAARRGPRPDLKGTALTPRPGRGLRINSVAHARASAGPRGWRPRGRLLAIPRAGRRRNHAKCGAVDPDRRYEETAPPRGALSRPQNRHKDCGSGHVFLKQAYAIGDAAFVRSAMVDAAPLLVESYRHDDRGGPYSLRCARA